MASLRKICADGAGEYGRGRGRGGRPLPGRQKAKRKQTTKIFYSQNFSQRKRNEKATQQSAPTLVKEKERRSRQAVALFLVSIFAPAAGT